MSQDNETAGSPGEAMTLNFARRTIESLREEVEAAKQEQAAALGLLSRMRFACGDNGLRMQDELESYLGDLRRDAERYRLLRRGQRWSVINGIGDTLRADSLDADVDAARAGEPR